MKRWWISALGAALVACSMEPQQSIEYEEIILTAGFEGTRTSIDDATGKMSWDPGDKISVFKGTSSPTGGSLFITEKGGSVATFSGTIAKDAALSLAKGSGTTLSFLNVCGAIRLRVATSGITVLTKYLN